MYKKLLITIVAAFCTLTMSAQSGGIKGQVVNRIGRTPVPAAEITVSQGGGTIAQGTAGQDGRFLFENIADGMYDMHVEAPGFAPSNVNVTVENKSRPILPFISHWCIIISLSCRVILW